MKVRGTLLLTALIAMAPCGFAVAQHEPYSSSPSQQDTTTPNSTATPSQNTSPSTGSSQHQQRQANKQSMKECIARQQQENSGMSRMDAKKACKAEMKNNQG